jgi:hypothetical protein
LTTISPRRPFPVDGPHTASRALRFYFAKRDRARKPRDDHIKHRLFSCSIEDDGVGFDVRAVQSDGKRRGLGLIGMQERLNGIGGTLSIDSARGGGTRLLIQLPADVLNGNPHRAS